MEIVGCVVVWHWPVLMMGTVPCTDANVWSKGVEVRSQQVPLAPCPSPICNRGAYEAREGGGGLLGSGWGKCRDVH